MTWFAREFIAAPEDRGTHLVYKWPDINIRRGSRVIVNADQTAVFVKSGAVVAALGPGRHRLDADEWPVLGTLADTVSGGNMYRAELYFIAIREIPGIRFGGRLTDITDPVSEQIVTLRAYGEFALTVRDPQQLITILTGTAESSDGTHAESVAAELLLKALKVVIAQGVSGSTWPVLGISAHLPQIESVVLSHVNTALYRYGLRIPRLGNVDITVAPEDADRLKRLAKDTTYVRLAGGYRTYALGELALGAPHAGSPHATADADLFTSAMGWRVLEGAVGADPAVIPREQSRYCDGCGSALVPTDARFCAACGRAVANNSPWPGSS